MKKALLIGINYKRSSSELQGCINDVMNMKRILETKFSYKPENITVLTDDTKIKPTLLNIMNKLNELVLDKEANQLFFHYSGHGTQVYDFDRDESDGRDECIIPLDYEKHGIITDDTLKNILKKMDDTKKLTCVIDACNSGSVLDLKYELNCLTREVKKESPQEYHYDNWSYEYRVQQKKQYHAKGNIMMISGCKDYQTSADAYINQTYQGALSYHLAKVLDQNDYKIKLKYLLKDVHILLKKGRYSQRPVMSSSRMFDLDQYFDM